MSIQELLAGLVPRPIHFRIGPLPISIDPGWLWIPMLRSNDRLYGRFHKHVKDAYNPRRWGGYFWMIEVGSRG